MATIRKRTWTKGDEKKEAWVADYFDQHGKRHIRTFGTKKAATAWLDETKIEVRKGVHTAPRASITVAVAGNAWLAQAKADGLETSTVRQYRQHLELHIVPLIGDVKLS